MSLARIGRLVLATGAVTGVVAAGIGTPAYADWWNWRALRGSNYAGVSINKRYIGACDLERDGNTVYAEYLLTGSTLLSPRLKDRNGSKAGCGDLTTSRDITAFRVCEDDAGSDSCSSWTDVP